MNASPPSARAARARRRTDPLPISVIVPARDAAATLGRCLRSIDPLRHSDVECIVVDDGSDDATPAIAVRHGARVVTMESPAGPAAARNRGARQARGEVLLFIDADVELHPDTLDRVRRHFASSEAADALVGSYDDDPPADSLVSRFKNLFHHYVHQHSNEAAQTFWAGCGAIRSSVLDEVGGFDPSYRHPSIEDIELGYRLVAAGHRIRLDRELQVKHLKRWSLWSMIHTDVMRRAVPWARLLIHRRVVPDDLNLRIEHRVSVAALYLAILMAAAALIPGILPSTMLRWIAGAVAAAASAVVLALNAPLYRFFTRRGGLVFAAAAVSLHWTYYLYSGLALLGALATFWVGPPGDVPRQQGPAR